MKRLQIRFPGKDFFISVFQGDVYVVGGTVRDHLLRKKTAAGQDIDLLITGLGYDEIASRLRPFGKTDTVGKSFAVLKFTRDKDPITYNMVLTILQDEVLHEEELQNLKEDLELMASRGSK